MSNVQFEKGQMVVYCTNGLCIVEDIRPIKVTSDRQSELYYILRQKHGAQTTFFVPVNNDKLTSKMRELLKKEDIVTLINNMKDMPMEWDDNRRVRNEQFHEILMAGVSIDLLSMIRCLHERRRILLADGKKLPVTDSNILKAAEKLVEEEFAFVLEIEPEKVGRYIHEIIRQGDIRNQ